MEIGDPHNIDYLSHSTPRELELLPKYRGGSIARIRKERVLPSEYGADFKVDTGLGITFFTDSESLAQQIERTRSPLLFPPSVDFVYLTKRSILPATKEELPPRPMGKGIPGDLLITPDLKHYALSGPEKYGSVISTILGISSFERATQGKLGLHAGQVYDKKYDTNHIFIGGSGSGKTTYVHLLESLYPDRFTVVADDWIEIDTRKGTTTPISKTVGARPETMVGQLLQKNPRVNDTFPSFDKTFFVEKNPKVTDRIGKIFQLHVRPVTPTPEGYTQLLREFDHHIPFMGELHGNLEQFPPNVSSRLLSVIESYLTLTRRPGYKLINTRQRGIETTLGLVLEEINNI